MKRDRHLTWENFRDTFIAPAVPAIHRLARSDTMLFVDAQARRIGLRTPVELPKAPLPSPLSSVLVETKNISGSSVMEISCSLEPLFQQFYAVLVDIADRIELKHLPPDAAMQEALRDWAELLKEAIVLSSEAQLGLMGELWFLARLVQRQGPSAAHAWVGPQGEPHDFRLAALEFEVKSTRLTTRVHQINSLQQLVPSSGRVLYLLSLQFEPSGAADGLSLPAMVQEVRSLLGEAPTELRLLNAALDRLGYLDADAARYQARLRLRSPPCLVLVDDGCPRITSDHLRSAISADNLARIGDVRYRIDVEGLGILEGQPGFDAIFPC